MVAIHVHIGSQIRRSEPQARSGGRPVPTVEQYAPALLLAVVPPGLPIVIEPGRAIVGPSGTLLARVIDLKPRNADSQFAVLDAGMAELMRPALYNAYHGVE